MGTISPQPSEIEMKSPGYSNPRVGWFHRTSASIQSIPSLVDVNWGW